MVRCGKCRFCYQLHNKSWCDYIEDYVCDDSSCEYGEFPEDYSEPQTNADRIRAMTDEELDEWLEAHCYQYGWLDWLKQEAKE